MPLILETVEAYADSKPEYAEVLGVYGAIRRRQEQVIDGCGVANGRVDGDAARRRLLANRPLLYGETVTIEPTLFHALARDLPHLLPEAWPLKAEANRVLEALSPLSQPALQALAAAYQTDRLACLETLAGERGVSIEAAGFVLQTLFSPFYEHRARPLRPFVADHLWTNGICPICGSSPQMAKVTAGGNQRHLGCDLCLTEWVYPRTGCPFCGEARPDNLPQFHLDGDRGRRVDLCKSCGGYIKTVDEREVRRSTYLPVEDIITAHLDLLAEEQGVGE